MVSSPVEGDTNQGSNPGDSKKNPLTGNPKKQWQGADLWHLCLVWALLPGGSCSGPEPNASCLAQVTVQLYRVKPGFGGFLGQLARIFS